MRHILGSKEDEQKNAFGSLYSEIKMILKWKWMIILED